MDPITFFVIAALVGGAGGLIYWYARTVGEGNFNAAFADPQDRKKVFILSAGIIVVTIIIIVGLWAVGVLKF